MSAEEFVTFYLRYYRLILTVAQQRLANPSDAEDTTSEVFRIAWKHHRDGNELTLPWLYQVLRNLIGNEYRKTARENAFPERLGAETLEAFVETNDDALEVRRAMLQLDTPDRELLYMAYWEDLTGQEIAAILGCSAVTVRVRLMRARKKLRGVLANAKRDGAGETQGVNSGRA